MADTREVTFHGGPLDGKTDRQVKALWPLGICYPPPGNMDTLGCVWVSPDRAAAPTRGHYAADYSAGPGTFGSIPMMWREATKPAPVRHMLGPETSDTLCGADAFADGARPVPWCETLSLTCPACATQYAEIMRED
jgi:hypothetical protein